MRINVFFKNMNWILNNKLEAVARISVHAINEMFTIFSIIKEQRNLTPMNNIDKMNQPLYLVYCVGVFARLPCLKLERYFIDRKY